MGFYRGPQIVRDGLVLYLDAANPKSYPGSGTTWSDLSGNGNNGTLVNGPAFSSGNNGSIVFDGVNDYISFNYTQPEQTTSTSFSWNVWVYPTRNSVVDIIMGNRNNILVFTKLTTVNFEYYPTIFGPNTPINQWINLCVVKDGTNLYYYQNSNLTTSTTSSVTKTSIPFFIGGDPIAGEYFKGNISQAQIYNRALSQSEITTIYNATKSRYGL